GIRDFHVTGVQTCALPISNKRAAQNAAVKLANMPGVGNAASMTGDADVQAISTAGRSYDFQAAKPIAAMAAAALNLPNVELLSRSEERRVGQETRCSGRRA